MNQGRRESTLMSSIPGSTDTGRWTEPVNRIARDRGISTEEAKKYLNREVPLDRMVMPGDIAGLAVFLASSRAVMFTRVAINVDGGRSRSI